MTAAIGLDTFLAHLNRPGATPAPAPQPKPTPDQPFPSRPLAPCVTDPGLHRWAPNADRARLTALHTAIAQDPPAGPLLADLNRAMAHSREVRS